MLVKIRFFSWAGLLVLGAPLAAVDLDSVQIHGFISQGYLHTTQTDWFGPTSGSGTFEFTEAALNASAKPLDNLRIGVQFLARDFADSGDNRVEIDWAFADWRAAERSGLKVGRIKMPYGLYNESRDLDFDHATVFLPQVIYLPQLRDYNLAINGAMLYGGADLGRVGQFEASLFGGGQNARAEGDLGYYLSDLGAGEEISSVRVGSVAGAAVTWQTPIDGLRVRLSGVGFWDFVAEGRTEGATLPGQPGAFADIDIHTSIDQFFSGVASLEYQQSGLTVAAEYLYEYGKTISELDIHPYTYQTVVPGTTTRLELPLITSQQVSYTLTEAMYAAASYRLADRYELSISRQLRLGNRSDPGKSYDRSWCLASRCDIFSNWLVKAEWQYHEGSDLDTGSDEPETWTVFALKTTVDF